MDIWHPTGLGHRSMPALWSAGQRGQGPEYSLGDVRQVPKSVQVFNACLYDKARGRSGLGLVSPGTAEGTEAQSKASLRSYASTRLEKQKLTHDIIEETTDINRLLSEAQMAFSAHQYTLAAVLYRRASNLGSAYACAFLSKLFGFGVVRANQSVFLFERDTRRGVAWGLVALQRIPEQLKEMDAQSAEYAAHWSLLNQALTLLCTLLCSQEMCQSMTTEESHADISMPLLLLFPRSCEVWSARTAGDDTLQAEGERRSVWIAMQEAMEHAQELFADELRLDEPTDTATLEANKALAQVHISFLHAFLTMRTAFLNKSSAAVEATYKDWSHYLVESRKVPDSLNLTRYRRVASEGQQWAAPDADKKIKAVVSDAELSALCKRISGIFPFAPDAAKRRQASGPALQDLSNMLRQPNVHASQNPRKNRTTSSSSRYPTRGAAGPALLSRATIAPVMPVPSQEAITVQNQKGYAGITSTRLRSMSGVQKDQRTMPGENARRERRPSTASIAEPPSYLARMNDEVPSFGRPRTSSIVSVSPSLMFPSKGGDSSAVLCDEPAMMSQAESSANPPATGTAQGSNFQNLRARLQRQASSASISAASLA